MPFITRPIGPGETLGVSSDTIRQLHHELAVNGFSVAGTESTSETFGPDTEARVRDFQSRYKLAVTGTLDQVTGGILALSTLVTTESDRTKLRAELKDAVNKVPNSPEYNYWLARYAIMVGDYTLGASISPQLTDLSGLNVDLGSAIFTDGDGPGAPRQPEVPFPENFYSYRNSLMLEGDITNLRIMAPSGGMPRLARASTTPVALGDPPPSPPPPGVPDPPPATGSGMTRPQQLTASALAILNAIEAWQLGNSEFGRQRYASAVQAYDRCQEAVLDYFGVFPDYNLSFTTNTLAARVDELIWRISSDHVAWADVWQLVNMRRQLLSLAEIGQFDWNPIDSTTTAYLLLQGNLKGQEQPDTPFSGTLDPRFRKEVIDSRLLVIAAVLVPLARGEANRLRRQYMEAGGDFTRVLRRR